jgi:hypothetical protein
MTITAEACWSADFFTRWCPERPTEVLLALATENEAFEPMVGQRWANVGLKLITHSRLVDRVDPEFQRKTPILASVHDVLSWAHTKGICA